MIPTAPAHECVLAVLPGACETEQLVVQLRHDPDRGAKIVLVQQSWGEGIGWFNQQCVELEPHQVAALKSTLGPVQGRAATAHDAGPSRCTGTIKPSRVAVPAGLRLWQAESA